MNFNDELLFTQDGSYNFQYIKQVFSIAKEVYDFKEFLNEQAENERLLFAHYKDYAAIKNQHDKLRKKYFFEIGTILLAYRLINGQPSSTTQKNNAYYYNELAQINAHIPLIAIINKGISLYLDGLLKKVIADCNNAGVSGYEEFGGDRT